MTLHGKNPGNMLLSLNSGWQQRMYRLQQSAETVVYDCSSSLVRQHVISQD